MPVFRNFRKFISIVLLFCLFGSIANALANRHAHQLSDGRIIWHAHPYKKIKGETGPIKSHQHSSDELVMLDLISTTMFFAGLGAFFLFFSTFYFKVKLLNIRALFIPSISINSLSFRGPPSSI